MCDCNKTTNISLGCCTPVLGPIQNYYTKYQIDRMISGVTTSAVTEQEMNEAISSAKTEIEAEIPSLSGYATEQWVTDQHYITGVDLSNYATLDDIPSLDGYATTEQMNQAISAATSGLASTDYVDNEISALTSDFIDGEELSSYTYDKATINSKIASATTNYVTLDEFGDYIMRLRREIDTLRQQVSGCCEIPPTPTPTGDTDCVVRIKYTQGEDFVISCEESYIGNLESFELPSPYTRPDATAVTVGNCTAQIGQTCFEDFFQLQTVYISSACTSIRLEAFYGCSALTTVTIEATTPPTMVWNNTFKGCTSLQHIYVPAQSVNAYKTAQYWSDYANIIEAIN